LLIFQKVQTAMTSDSSYLCTNDSKTYCIKGYLT